MFKSSVVFAYNAHISYCCNKKDTVNKLVSLMDNFKQISFQKELIHTWHKNKTFHYSKIVQNGIRGKVYAKWQHKYNQQEEYNKSTSNLQVKYKQIESKEKTTKNCICGKTNDIKLKDNIISPGIFIENNIIHIINNENLSFNIMCVHTV